MGSWDFREPIDLDRPIQYFFDQKEKIGQSNIGQWDIGLSLFHIFMIFCPLEDMDY